MVDYMFNVSYRKMSESPRVAVVGCGIFGAMIALRLAKEGANVEIFESQKSVLMGASYNNQNRLHLGYHYPRDDNTARQCIKGFEQFYNEFKSCLLENFPNSYFISKNDSIVTPNEYLKFCNRVGLKYDLIDLKEFTPNIRNVDLGISTAEVVYDCNKLRALIIERLNLEAVTLQLNSNVSEILRKEDQYILRVNGVECGLYDVVINCTYANINLLNDQLGYKAPTYQYEYTAVPIIEWDQPPLGITVMDGEFMTVLPFGQTGLFLLYHVKHAVIASQTTSYMPSSWLELEKSPLKKIDREKLFQTIKKNSAYFVPSLLDAKLTGFLEGPRIVLANDSRTDSRPSIINHHENGYWSVFTGKVAHCMWVAEEITEAIFSK